jgi:hypothetical protein
MTTAVLRVALIAAGIKTTTVAPIVGRVRPVRIMFQAHPVRAVRGSHC